MSSDSLSSDSASSASPLPAYPTDTEPSSVSSSLSSSPTHSKLVENPGPRGILTLRSRAPSMSSIACTNVRFAPLPELAPRRRRSTAPLGISARGAMMRKRRGLPDPQEPAADAVWVDENTKSPRAESAGAEDPLASLGKMMKGAWRKMNGLPAEKPRPPTKVVTGMTTTTLPHVQDQHQHPIVPVEDGAVWEEEIMPRSFGHTDTIRESDVVPTPDVPEKP